MDLTRQDRSNDLRKNKENEISVDIGEKVCYTICGGDQYEKEIFK